MSINWQLDVEPAPAILVLPPAADSLDEAHAAIELWEHYSRKTLDPAQRLTVEVMMATAGGRWAAATTGREMPRQNGKGDELEVVELWGLTQRSEAILHTVHEAVLLASQAQQRMLGVLEGHPDLRRLVKRKWQGTGQQMVEMRNGGIIWYRTRTGGGGRGVDDVDRLVVDEAQHATDEHIDALSPTLLANPDPQMNVAGTAGLDGRSSWWWSIRKRALGSSPGAFGYVGHTADRVTVDERGRVTQHEVDVSDRGLWGAANPSVVAGRGGGMEFLEEQFRRMTPAGFAREHLCVWDPEPTAVTGVVPMDMWSACRGQVRRVESGVFAVDVAPEARAASICLSDGEYVEIVKHGPGTGWVVPSVKAKGVPVVVDPTGPASALVADLEAAGVTVHKVSTQEATGAAQSFLTAVIEGRLVHIGQSELDAAVGNADRRDIGDGGWLWSRRKSSVDISPLVAATLARWAAVSAPDPKVEFLWL